MRDESSGRVQVRVHERGGDRAIDGVIRLIEEAALERPLADVLRTLCVEVAGILRAEVVSAYLTEPGGEVLVMRGNVGFAPHAVGSVRLRVGEGITGFCASSLRPISVAVASDDAHYKHVPGIGEEQFPCYAAVPIFVAGKCAGVLVAQRRAGEAFAPAEVALATALATPFAHALDLAKAREAPSERPTSSAPARLVGLGLAGGAAVGRGATLPTFESLAEREEDGHGLAAEPSAQAVSEAFVALERDVARTLTRLDALLDAAARAQLGQTALLLHDSRLLGQCMQAAREHGVARGLARVGRDYGFAPFRGGATDAWLHDRGAEAEDLCLLVASRALGDRVPAAGCVLLVAERPGALLSLLAVAQRVAAIVVGAEVPGDAAAAAVARAAGLPLVAGVNGIFSWSRAGDAILVDGDEGVVRVSPPASAIARLRHDARAAR